MTWRKLCGFDVNGWRDFAARNWRTMPGEEEETGPSMSFRVVRCHRLSGSVKGTGTMDRRASGGHCASRSRRGVG